MKTNLESQKGITESEIDQEVAAMANDDAAWDKPIRVHRTKATSLSIPANLSERAAFLAQLHHKASVEEWLMNIIRERVEIEEAAFAGAKRDLATKNWLKQ